MNGSGLFVTDAPTSNPEGDSAPDGFPNGQRFDDDVLDIAITVVIGDLGSIPISGSSSETFEFNTNPGESNADSHQVENGVVVSFNDKIPFVIHLNSGSDGQTAAIGVSRATEDVFVGHGATPEFELFL